MRNCGIFSKKVIGSLEGKKKPPPPGDCENISGLVPLRHLVEKLDNVGEVHVSVKDDVAIALHQTEGDE
jgi:hypothetical protein